MWINISKEKNSKQLLCINPLSLDLKLTFSSSEGFDLRRTVSDSCFMQTVTHIPLYTSKWLDVPVWVSLWRRKSLLWPLEDGIWLLTWRRETAYISNWNKIILFNKLWRLFWFRIIIPDSHFKFVLRIHFVELYVSTVMKTCISFESCKHSDENLLHPFQEL